MDSGDLAGRQRIHALMLRPKKDGLELWVEWSKQRPELRAFSDRPCHGHEFGEIFRRIERREVCVERGGIGVHFIQIGAE